nr:Chain A, Chitinase A [Pteris ryukyuensis]4PXV_B Chain B, Chitinase A [Pteris ryukyuensis]4PXV_C Chain C, Chitinase A [Pteris ryukyuensis]4PXV_D Chain D, Chitinase A [Pteris ryukyuensis]5YLG_A Chain A, Chitinase A [Pteris ryukyuensis]5YLG_B Chain B, Chitinase A [Pteris ryukyuensis]5YLG_C Chain C, Chitinase A [Pteris ryukyuensis]5YLG_D Chain D, Chitinase A [Pteris ryukyuensis]
MCTTYTIKSGDTCYAISQARGISLSDFESWNAGIDCNNLQIGQVVCVSK